MSLSPEALAQLEGLDLREVKAGLDFAPIVESGRPTVADLTADEMNGFRAWDFSGVLAGLNSLTFKAMHPELVLPPAPMPESETGAVLSPDGGGRAPTGEDYLPEWLRPADSPVTYSRPTIPREVSLEGSIGVGEPFQPEIVSLYPETSPATGAMTEPEWTAEGPEDRGAGEDEQASSDEEAEATIRPAAEEDTAVVETKAEKGLAQWLKKIDFGKLAKEGARYLIPPLTGLTMGRFLSPEQALNLTQTAIEVGMLGFIGSGGCAVMERVVSGHPRVAGIGRLLAAGRVVGAVFAETGMLMAAGSFAGGLWHEREIVRQAAAQLSQPAAAGGGEGFNNPHPIHRPVEAAGQFGGLSPEDRGIGAVVQPPVESGGVAAGAGQRGASPAEELQQMAEAAQGAAEMAARQAALDAATKVVQVQPGNTLTGLIDAAGGNAYGKDFTDTVLQSANILTGPQNPNRDMAKALIDFIKVHPGGVNWRDAINGVGDLAKQTVGGLPLKDAIAQATRMIYPGQEMKIVVGAAMP